MAKFKQSELKKKDSLVLVDKSSGQVQKVVFPNGLQVGLASPEFNKGIILQDLGIVPADTSNALYVVDGVLHYNGSPVNSGGGSALTVEEADGSPSVSDVTKIKVSNGTLTDDGSGTVTITTGGGGGSGAPADAQYVVLATSGDLSDERVLTMGTGLDSADGGAGGNITVSLDLTEVIASDGANRVLTSDGDGTLTAEANITYDGNDLLITATDDSSSAAPIITLKRNSSSPAAADYLGQLKFKAENDADQEIVYAKMTGKISDKSDGSEDGIIEFANIKDGSQTITARLKSDVLELINSTNLSVDGTAEFSEYLYHKDDADTFIQFADDAIGITAGGEQLVTISEAGQDIVKIGDGGDVDFQVRTLNDDNTLYIEGSTDRIGIGTNSPSSIVHIKESAPTLTLQRENNSNASTISFVGMNGNTANSVTHDSSTNDLVFKTFNGSAVEEIMRIGDHYGVSNRQIILLSGSDMHAGATQPREATDIAFFVSGAINSKNTNVQGTAVFGGDVSVSGSLLFVEQNLSNVRQTQFAQIGETLNVTMTNLLTNKPAEIKFNGLVKDHQDAKILAAIDAQAILANEIF